MAPRTRFVLIWGVLGWGIPVFITWCVLMAAWQSDWGFVRALVVYGISLPLWLGGGYLYGSFMWKYKNKHTVKPDEQRNRRGKDD